MRRDRQRLEDMLEALDWIADRVVDKTITDFIADEMFCFAISRQLSVVGEAAARLTKDLTRSHPDIPWADIIAFRNILIHEYFGIDWATVWDTSVEQAPALRRQIETVLASLP